MRSRLPPRIRVTGQGVPASDSVTLEIEVVNQNGVPVVAEIANHTLAVGATLDLAVTATDPELEPLVLSVDGLPPFANLVDHGDGTGAIHFAPQPGERGNYVLKVNARDQGDGNPDESLVGSRQFMLTVDSPNEPPVMAPVGRKTAQFGQEISLSDPCGLAGAWDSVLHPSGTNYRD